MNKEFENFLKEKQDITPKNSLVENFSEMFGKTDINKLNDDKSKMVSQLAPPDQNKPPGGEKKEGKPPGGDKKDGKPPGGEKKEGKSPGGDKKDGKPPGGEGNDDVSIQQIKVKDKDAVLITSQKGGDKPSIVVMADESLMQNQEELKKLPEEIGGQGGDNKEGNQPGGEKKDGKPPGGEKKDDKPPGGDKKDGKPPGGEKTPPPGKGSPLKSSNSENNTLESSGSKDKLDLLLGKNKEDKKDAFWTTVMIDDTPKKVLVNVKTFTVLESMGDLKNKASAKESEKKDKGIMSTFDFSDTKSEKSKKIQDESKKLPEKIQTDPKKKLEESKNDKDKSKKDDEDCENDLKKMKENAKNKKESSKDKKDDSKPKEEDKIKYETKDYEKTKSGENESLWSSIFSSGTDSDKDKANQKRLEGGSTKEIKVDSKAISTKLPVLKPLNQTTTIKMDDPIKKDSKKKSESSVFIDKINKKTDEKEVAKDKKKTEKDKKEKDKEFKKEEKEKDKELKKDEKEKDKELKKDEKEKAKDIKKDEKEKIKEKEKEIKKNEKENDKKEKEADKKVKDKELKKNDKEENNSNKSKKAIESVIFQNDDKDMKSISAKNSNTSKKNNEASVDDLLYVLKNMPGKVNINKEGKEIYIEGDFFAPKDKKLGQNSFNFSGILKSKEGKKN